MSRSILLGRRLWKKSEKLALKANRLVQILFWRNGECVIMPLVYADSSVLFAYFHPRDEFSVIVDVAVQKLSPDFLYWSFLRFELRHNLRICRVDTDGEVAWRALRAAERTTSRLRWQADLAVERVLDAAEELSADKSSQFNCGSADYLHVAAARRLNLLNGLDEFWTCDAIQVALAKAAGLKTRLFLPEQRRRNEGL
jgi:predicted nucleic acid-binding protein